MASGRLLPCYFRPAPENAAALPALLFSLCTASAPSSSTSAGCDLPWPSHPPPEWEAYLKGRGEKQCRTLLDAAQPGECWGLEVGQCGHWAGGLPF